MSRLIFNCLLGGTVTLDATDTVSNRVLIVPAADGTLLYDDGSGTQTFDNIALTGAVTSGAWNGSTIDVAYGGTGATTLTGYVKGNGTSSMTAFPTIPNTDITGLGTMSVQNANNVNISGGVIGGLSSPLAIGSGGTGVTTLTGLVYGNGTSAMSAATASQVVAVIGSTYVANATNATNAVNATTSTNIAGGVSGSLPYQTAAGTTALLPKGTNGQVLSLVAGLPAWVSVSGAGTVTSVDGSGGTTGLTLTGGPITSSGTLTLGGTLNVANGGTGSGTAAGARSNLSAAVLGSNNDITSMSGLTGAIGSPLSIQFGNGSGTTLAAGKMWYNNANGSLNFGMGGGNITQQVGEELFRYGKASSAISDNPLQIVYKTGVVGGSGVITFAPTVPGITESDLIIGVATENISINNFGRVTTYGVVRGINTTGSAYGETWADGDDIWYNPVTGNPTKTKPNAPNIKLQIGTVINAGAGSGSFIVKLGSSSSLGGTDSNVQLGTLANKDLLQYDSAAQYWKNVTPASITGVGSAVTLTTTLGVSLGGTGVTTLTGLVKGNGTSAFSAASAGTDYVAPATATNFTAQQYFGNVALTDAATISWAANTAQVATFTFVSSSRTMGAPTGLVNGAFYSLAVIQNGGSNTLTWNSVFKWAGGTAPTLSTAAGAKDFFEFRSDGTNLYEVGRTLGVA